MVKDGFIESPDLNPCPFCGSKSRLFMHTPIKDRPIYYTVHCYRCGVSNMTHFKTKERAIAAWNGECNDKRQD